MPPQARNTGTTIARPSPSWDPVAWIEAFRKAGVERDHDALHQLRADVFQTTIEAVRRRSYETGGARIELDAGGEYRRLQEETVFYPSTDDLVTRIDRRRVFETAVSVVPGDSLDTAFEFVKNGQPPLVLNMASRQNPGGGALGGAGAQEENLFRRSNLFWSLYQFAEYAEQYGVTPDPAGHQYPIPRSSGGIYSPDAQVFRSSEATGYALLPAPYPVSFVTVPAINRPAMEERDGQTWLTPQMTRITQGKIRAILRIAAHHGHLDLVLGAFGCGAFRNPPHHMARLFREILEDQEFAGVFRHVAFAILDDHNAHRPDSREGNLLPFQRELEGTRPD